VPRKQDSVPKQQARVSRNQESVSKKQDNVPRKEDRVSRNRNSVSRTGLPEQHVDVRALRLRQVLREHQNQRHLPFRVSGVGFLSFAFGSASELRVWVIMISGFGCRASGCCFQFSASGFKI